ncbi:hypothetical protein PEX1_086350 [Penicillium expansum]|uniref:Uncharacterized protein n=1 Tax=Penicillium expansum TaxID=27334 RepID=A0A0A2IAS1_PENEN|nr:hypothetical protein PEX2_076850 [Penicillium expansum]KGO39516.1 hypothetical protein PEXP_049310 [Penicillium expansum]KGO56857.1 hypothetical protein PEX2_076850 [Penicillium expansum]KGO60040.1 hypothetical protein PEX1_086350 [Penicillium expansum]
MSYYSRVNRHQRHISHPCKRQKIPNSQFASRPDLPPSLTSHVCAFFLLLPSYIPCLLRYLLIHFGLDSPTK